MRLQGVTRNVVVLGLVSLFNDISTEMVYPLIPLFVVGTLGTSPALLGLIEGLAEGLSSSLRWAGGWWSDRAGRRKPFITAGYGVSALSKPIMALAAYALGWPLFLVGRSADRLGKSVRTAARDALIADSTESAYRGVAFGFHRALDTGGAIIGPLIALAVVVGWPGVPLAMLFFVAFVPGILSVLVAGLGVRDVDRGKTMQPVPNAGDLPRLPAAFWHLLAAAVVFSLGNSSDSFLLLRSKELGLSFESVILAYALFNVSFAVAATPLGHLSDRVGRKPVIIAGWLTYAVVYLGFAWFRSPLAPWILLAVYGLFQALTDGVMKALVTDVVPERRRAAAIGLLAAAMGLAQLVASVVAGAVWGVQVANGALAFPFVLGSACALLALPIIASVARPAGAIAAPASPA